MDSIDFSVPNTIYTIKETVNLNGGSVVVGDNSTLRFEGGKFANGTIIGKGLVVDTSPYLIFDNISFKVGSSEAHFASYSCYPEWFGAKGDGTNDDRIALQAAMDSPFMEICLLDKEYVIKSSSTAFTKRKVGIVVGKPKIIKGNYIFFGSTGGRIVAKDVSLDCILQIASNNVQMFHLNLSGHSEVKDIISTGGKSDSDKDADNFRYSLKFEDVITGTCGRYGFNLTTFFVTMRNCLAAFCDTGFFIHGIVEKGTTGTALLMSQCYALENKHIGYDIQFMGGVELHTCTADRNGNSGTVADYTYRFVACTNLTLDSCSTEECAMPLSMNMCKSSTINSFSEWASAWNSNADNAKRVSLDNCSGVVFNRCNFESKPPTEGPECKTVFIRNSQGVSFLFNLIRVDGNINYKDETLPYLVIERDNCRIENSFVQFNDAPTVQYK